MLLVLLLQVAVVESLREVSGYLGETVTLSSGADPSWNLSSIEWSIFSNNTWIATHRNGKTNIERVYRYKGRLRLNISSGDLMIRNLTQEDDMEYTVHLVNTQRHSSGDKTRLTVRPVFRPHAVINMCRRPQSLVLPLHTTVGPSVRCSVTPPDPLQQPTIQTGVSSDGSCRLWLLCSSSDKGINLFWSNPSDSETIFSSSSPDGSTAVLVVLLTRTQDSAEFSCTCSRNMETTSRSVLLRCDDQNPPPGPPGPPGPPRPIWTRGRSGLVFVGVVLVCLLTVFMKFSLTGRH